MASTKAQLRTQLEELMSSVGINGFYSDTMKDHWINKAGRRVVNYRHWNILKHAKRTQSEKDQEWYQQPGAFKPASIFRITMGRGDSEVEYTLYNWDEYKEKKLSGEPMSALLGDQYFISPIPTEDGQEIGVYGVLKWKELVDDADEAITDETFDEAIIKYALADAFIKESEMAQAKATIDEVEGVILARLEVRETQEPPKGYVGKITGSRS